MLVEDMALEAQKELPMLDTPSDSLQRTVEIDKWHSSCSLLLATWPSTHAPSVSSVSP